MKEVSVLYKVELILPLNGCKIIDTWAKFLIPVGKELDCDEAKVHLEERYLAKLGAIKYNWIKFEVQP